MRFGWLKLHYLLAFALNGAYLPFMPLYLRQLGMEDWQIGWTMGISGAAVLLSPVLMTHLADRRWSNRGLIGAANAGQMAALLAIAAIGATSGGPWHFALILGLTLFFAINQTPAYSLLDGLTFAAIHEAQHRREPRPPYHAVRLWGSFGFMLPAAVLLILLAQPGATYRAAVVTGAVCALLGAINSFMLPRIRSENATDEQAASPSLPSAAAWRAAMTPPARTMMFSMLLIYTAISVYYAFYSRLLEQLRVPPAWIGPVVNLGVLSEIALVLGAGAVLRRIGLRGVLLIGTGAMVVRMGLLALPLESAQGIAVAVASQVLHAPIVLLLYFVVPMYMNVKAGPRFRNSMQGLHSVMAYGVARLTGSALGGHVAQIDLRYAFATAAGLSAVAMVWGVLGFRDEEACEAIGGINRQKTPLADEDVLRPAE